MSWPDVIPALVAVQASFVGPAQEVNPDIPFSNSAAMTLS